ncbi:hypothetical protein RYB01_17305 [Pseudomonas syringae]|nr:hypothetical protein [Pseudomonas syringae]
MDRDSFGVKRLLGLFPPCDACRGIYLDDLLERWRSSSGDTGKPLEEAEFFYLANRCADSGFLSVSKDWVIQITRSGHDYLDSKAKNPSASD